MHDPHRAQLSPVPPPAGPFHSESSQGKDRCPFRNRISPTRPHKQAKRLSACQGGACASRHPTRSHCNSDRVEPPPTTREPLHHGSFAREGTRQSRGAYPPLVAGCCPSRIHRPEEGRPVGEDHSKAFS